ncbi:MAG: hypothetical protein CMH64_04575 [Nanoarchaeota archaeon]|nr:hypothetical protein [Nanoarchaeota archaeon]|tara:strand:+ start:2388 stop:3065 length:678 start_codon:yes stop_codon:yes gene_type:complete
MLKAQLHIHSHEDPRDRGGYTAKDVIDKASELNFDVIAFTFHDILFYPQEIQEYAKSKDILLIPGIEKTIEKSHVLILGLTELPELNKIEDLKKLPEEALIIAAHPFLPLLQSLKEKLLENIDLFHGIEHHFFYRKYINFNKKAIKIAKKHNKTIVGTSDVHDLKCFSLTYSLIDSKKNKEDVINAIKRNKIKVVTKPAPFSMFYPLPLKIFSKKIFYKIFKKNH